MYGTLPVLVVSFVLSSTLGQGSEAPVQQKLVDELTQRFDKMVGDPAAYKKRVDAECAGFPEGDLFPYLFPIYAYTNLTMRQPERREEMLGKVRRLLDVAIPEVAQRIGAPDLVLTRLTDYRQHGTYVCQLNVGLGAARLLGDVRHEKLHQHLTQLIRTALAAAKGGPVFSFPGLIWPFDTIPCLFSLALYELGTGTSVDAGTLSKQHFKWIAEHGRDEATGLPCSQVHKKTLSCIVAPRGCDLSFRLMMQFQFAPKEAKALYDTYVNHFWKERLVAAGFAEWPDTDAGQEDVDSGPIIMGIGTAASALGLGAVKAAGDEGRFARMVAQTQLAAEMVKGMLQKGGSSALLGGVIQLSPEYTSGFLYGDAVLFWGLTGEKWRRVR